MNIDWSTIPTKPGVYLWKNSIGQVIYVGKAKNLRNRMKQYFRDDLPPKSKLLLKYIADFDFQVSASELDALILEQTLINEYEPKFNVKIKSAKTYPYIEVRSGKNLKLSLSKTVKFIKNTKYYGPYPDGYSARRIINMLSSVFPVDTCLAPESGKPCLNYEMGRCMGQCINDNIENKMKFSLDRIEDFFKGDVQYVENKLLERLKKMNELLQFEDSRKIYDDIELIEKIKQQTTYAFKDTKHRDFINYFEKDGIISISMTLVRFGKVTITLNFMNKLFNPNPKDAVEEFLERAYKRNPIPDEVVMPFEPEWKTSNVKVTVPTTGTKFQLLELTKVNAETKFISHIDGFLNKIKSYDEAIKFIKANTKDKLINTIEMVDISSLQGQEQVGAVVNFLHGEPNKSQYRKYIIQSTNKMDDYAATEEVVRRHFKRKLDDETPLPDIFIVDGKNQLLNAKKIFDELGIKDVILCALKKDDKHKTNALINIRMEETPIESTSHMYLFLARIQEEVHRFVISFHRSRRNKVVLESALDKYVFLDEFDKQILFKEFKSIRKMLLANEAELSKVIGKTKSHKFIKERGTK